MKILEKDYKDDIAKIILSRVSKEQEGDELVLLTETIAKKYSEEYERKDIETALDKLFNKKIRQDIMEKGKRADGRDTKTIRPISGEVGLLPRTHGSAMFKRGQTQV